VKSSGGSVRECPILSATLCYKRFEEIAEELIFVGRKRWNGIFHSGDNSMINGLSDRNDVRVGQMNG
jgi:hypothetical protein